MNSLNYLPYEMFQFLNVKTLNVYQRLIKQKKKSKYSIFIVAVQFQIYAM